MDLVKINRLHAQTAQALFTLAANRVRLENLANLSAAIAAAMLLSIAFGALAAKPEEVYLDKLDKTLDDWWNTLDTVCRAAAGMIKPECADHRGQSQSLAYEGHENDGKRQEKNEIAMRKGLPRC